MESEHKAETILAIIGAGFLGTGIFLGIRFYKYYGEEVIGWALLLCLIGILMIWGPVLVRKFKRTDNAF